MGDIGIDEARELLASVAHPVHDVEQVALPAALGRVLAGDLVAPIDVPPADNSAMDGWALHSSSKGPLAIIGTARAGKPFAASVGAGECVRILTGALLPRGCDAVVMQERARRDGDRVTFDEPAVAGQNVRPAGEDFAQGTIALRAGRELRPVDLGVASSFGLASLPVRRKVRVGFLSTGDELVAAGSALEPGKLYDSNRAILRALIERAGSEPIDLGHASDDEASLRSVVANGAEGLDVIVSTGGVAVGDADCIPRALSARTIEVAMRPGRHLAYARIGDCAFFGLPGNPVAVVTTFDALIAPVLRRIGGAEPRERLLLRARLLTPLKNTRARVDFHRGVLSRQADGVLVVRSTGHQGAGILRSLVEANCFIVVPPNAGEIGVGATVDVEPFLGLERL